MFLMFGVTWNESDEGLSWLYWNCEVSLIAYMFEKFQNNSSKNYGLYLSHYLSTAWMQCLKWQKFNWNFFLILTCTYSLKIPSYISNICSKAKNKYLKFYDSKQESKHII